MYVLGIYRSLISASLNSHDRLGNRFFNSRNGEIPRGRRKGAKPEKAVFTTISNTGRAIVTSGLTMVGGFAAMMTSPFPIMGDFGFVCVLSIIFSLIAALTLVPAFLVFMDHRKMKRAATTIASPTTGGSSSL